MQALFFANTRIACSSKPTAKILTRKYLSGTRLATAVRNGSKCQAFFNFNKNKNDTDTARTMTRDDFGVQEVEDYFNYMGMLASEGTYDRMEAMLASGEAPVDLLLLMASSENDTPKIEELLGAGADPTRKDLNGRTALELCTKDEIKEMLEGALPKL